MLRRIAASTVVALSLLSAGAFAYWSNTGQANASASLATLSAPAISSATAGAGTVALTWSAVTAPAGGTVEYYVTRDGGAPSGGCPSSSAPATATSCTDTGVSIGTHEYTVTTVWRSWTATSMAKSATVTFGPATHFQIQAASTTPTAGETDNLTITAKDASNNTVSTYSGAKTLSFSEPSSSPNGKAPSYPATVTFAAGAGTAAIKLYDAQTTTVKATEGTIEGTSPSLTVKAAATKKLTVPTPSEQEAGAAFNVTLTATDEYANTTTGYAGAKTLAWSGPANAPNGTAPEYPTSASTVTFTEGVGTAAQIKLYDAQSTTLKVKEGTIEGTSAAFTVKAAAAASFSLPTPAEKEAGATISETVTALDTWHNTAKSYAGAKTLAFSEPASSPSGKAPSYPATVTFTAGAGTASIKLYDAQSTTLKVTEGAIEGASGSFTVKATTPERFAWSHAEVGAGKLEAGTCPFACTTTSIGASKKFKAHASVTDAYGNIVSNIGATNKAKVEQTSGAGTLANATGLSIPASGLAESATIFEYTSPPSGTSEAVLKLKSEEGTAYTEAEAHVKY